MAGNPELIGRRAEREILDQLATSVQVGQGRVLVLRGEAGAGKTALLDYLAMRAGACRIARVACVESDKECAFHALHRLCEATGARIELLPGPQRHAAEVAFGLRNADGPDGLMIGLATLSLLSDAASVQPLMWMVDDAQWLDRASAQALGFAARRLAEAPAGLIFTLRDPATGGDFAQLPQLVLPALAYKDANALLDSGLTGPVDREVRDRMLAEARGIPLRLREIASAQTPEDLAGGFGLPPVVAAAAPGVATLLRHLDTLPQRARLLLLIAAAEPAGNPPLVWRAADLLGLKAARETSAAAVAIAEFGAPVRFRHHLARSVIYWAASPADRQDVHLALAAGINPHADPHRYAWHLAHASSGPDEDVAATMEAVAGSVGSRGGLAAAGMFYEHAAMRTPEAARAAQRALVAARAKHLLGAHGSALRLLEIARAGPLDDLGRAHADLLHAQLVASRTLAHGASVQLLRAARHLEALDPVLASEGYRDALDAALAAGRLAGRHDLLEVATAVRTARAENGQQSSADLVGGLAVLATDGYAVGAPAVRQALGEISGEADDGPAGCVGLQLACRAARTVWDYPTWRRLSSRLVEAAGCAGALGVLPAALHDEAMTRVLAGDFASATAMVSRAETVALAVAGPGGPYGSLALAAWKGAQEEVARLAAAATPRMLARDEGQWPTAVGWATALAGNSLGQYGQALAAAERGAADADELGLAAWCMAELVEAAARLGSPERARDALDRLGELAKASATDWARGILARSQALASRDATAEEHYREAITLLDRAGLRPEMARARLVYGEWLRRHMRRSDAREQLRAAYQTLTSIGAAGFANRARCELAATGEMVRKRVPETTLALTGREAQIAGLAADGCTNQEIGVRLFLSARTVEWYMQKVYVKLGVRSRKELRGAMLGADRHQPRSVLRGDQGFLLARAGLGSRTMEP